jgi:hypothetical protein
VIPYTTYKVVHYLGVFLLLAALSATLARAAALSGDRGDTPDPWRRRLFGVHGAALFLILLGGFGMLARLEVTEGLSLPAWIWAKLAIWVVLGGLVAARRVPRFATPALLAVPLLAACAGWIALYKPF